MKTASEWKKIGVVGVDSGQLMICDPCYIDSEWKKEEFDSAKKPSNFSYNGVSQATLKRQTAQMKYALGHSGVAVVFRSGLGDGLYDVFAKIEDVKYWGRRVTEVRIKLVDAAYAKKMSKAMFGNAYKK